MERVNDRWQPPLYDRWIDDDKKRLTAENITNYDMQYGCELVLKKRELEAVTEYMTHKEWQAI